VSDDLTSTLELPPSARVAERTRGNRRRLIEGLRHPGNQKQLGRFLCVGASGYIVNTASFWLFLHAAGLDYKLAFCCAFVFGCANNFFWNRRWTFEAYHDHPVRQGARFFAVSLLVAVCAYFIMVGLVHTTDMWKVPADALAWIIVTPVSFLVQKLWSFKA
jgi:putative flippase GtrA